MGTGPSVVPGSGVTGPGRRWDDGTVSLKILVVDNYDSFVWTIAGYLTQLGADCRVVRNDAIGAEAADGADAVLLSPGPGTPAEAGVSADLVRRAAETATPLLGVCLGHQVLSEVYGATVTHADELLHGKTSQVVHDRSGIFEGLPTPFTATRYHSLAVVADTVPADLAVTAATEDGVVMGLQHRTLPLYGVQFHPESVMTQGGHRLFANWLATAGDPGAVERSEGMAPLVTR